jgi:hypothetical protein
MTLLLSQSIFGQENDYTASKFGIGVSLFNLIEEDYEALEYGNPIYFTINIGRKFRLEPTVGYFSDRWGEDKYSIGIGGFVRKSISNFNFLYGIRVGLRIISREEFRPFIERTTVIAPTLGGEYFFIKNFSIGSEVQLKGLLIDGNWTVFTNSSVLVRFYF